MTRGIPTVYRGRQYRSRLEARWAAMFDLLGWEYEYEPYDLAGWIPDFVLLGDTHVLVEVKATDAHLPDAGAKATNAAEKGTEILLLTSTPFRSCCPEQSHVVKLGLLGAWTEESFEICFSGAAIGKNRTTRKWDFGHDLLGFEGRVSGSWWQDFWGREGEHRAALLQLWAESGNTVQWRPPR